MHIARLIDLYSPTFFGGGQTHVRELSKALRKIDCDSLIFSQDKSGILYRFFWSVWVIPQVLFHHVRYPFDLIHSHGFIPGLPAYILGILLRKPVIHSVHGSHLMDQNDPTWKGRLEKFLLTDISYSLIISDSRHFLKYKTKAKKNIAIANGVNLKQFQKIEVKRRAEKPTMVFIGRLEPLKGIDLLVESLIELKEQLPLFNLWIMGSGYLEDELKKRIKKAAVENQITFLGSLKGEAYIKMLKKAHLFILPSLAEGQPISLLDAWACKVPVLVTKVGDNPYMVQDGKNGYLVEPGSKDALKETLVKAFSEFKKWPAMGEDGYRFIKEDGTWAKVADKVLKQYMELYKRSSKEI